MAMHSSHVEVEPAPGQVRCLAADQFYRMSFVEWRPELASAADRSESTVFAVHGLTRNGRDFDALAKHLSSHGRRVICPDVVGRGQSEWLHSKSLYQLPTYASAMASLHAATCATDEQVDWVGTSMGGVIGLVLASLPGSPVRRLVLNDVGPLVSKEGLSRLGQYCGKEGSFGSLVDVEVYLRSIYKPFGDLSDAQWAHLAKHTCRLANEVEAATARGSSTDGSAQPRYVMRYDPGIAQCFQGAVQDVDLWAMWERVRCPVLVIRGEFSDVLSRETVEEMRHRRPDDAGSFELYEVKGVGHAPS
eukprot:CAMPEP_0177644086 /NCGR_PEP_ID=MMETSP0447-20121125/8492_1 /TAXON_ID=0 /ORGANISM="Stygamoeba regulata, Strain BSH-02190019" /LENGTH=303 /DNA_ID=CAMNT_0019146407 /DNA_START=142 /DNA_END=1050 /DNA_ORIENTATION=+